MNATTTANPTLTLEEWDVVHELLVREWSDLAVEIRHTKNSSLKDQLHKRRNCIRDLIDRLWPEAA